MTNSNTATLAKVQLSQVIEQLNHLSTDELVNVYMDYAEQNSYERIYNLDENTINELYSSPWQALYESNHKDFNDRDYFFTYNGNGHMVSFSNEDDKNCPIDIEELSQWIVDNDLFNDYDIEVTTLDDMYNAILDNLEDANSLNDVINVAEYLELPVDEFDSNNESPADYECHLITTITDHIYNDETLLQVTAEFMKLDV